MNPPDYGFGSIYRYVLVLNHPMLDDSLYAGYDVLSRDWLADQPPDWKPDRPADHSFEVRAKAWQEQVAPIHQAIEERTTRETNLAIGVVGCLPFAASLGLTLGVTALLPFIPPPPFFLLQLALWLGGCAALGWLWVEQGARPRRAFRAGLPPRPDPAAPPSRDCLSPLYKFHLLASSRELQWPTYIRHYPGVWPPTDGQPGELEVLGNIQALGGWLRYEPEVWLVLHGLKLGPRTDADLIVLTPWGVRLLEVKYWQGEIRYRGGRWTHINHFYGRGGVPLTKERDERDPLAQVRSQLNSLRRVLPRSPGDDWLRGAVVFSHPDSWLEHDPFPAGVNVLTASGVGDWLSQVGRQRLYTTSQLFGMAVRLIRHDAQFNPYRSPDATPLDMRVRQAITDWREDDRNYLQAAEEYQRETAAALADYARKAQDWQTFMAGTSGANAGSAGRTDIVEKST